MKTSAAYIHEYSILDDVNESLSEAISNINEASYKYNCMKRDFELKSFFEQTSTDVFMEKEAMGFFEKIGNAIMKIIKKIADTIAKFTSKFFNKEKEMKTDEEIVTQIITENPELKKAVCQGINEKWFTYKDVAGYQKDIVGLVQMLEQQTISHKAFREKCLESMEKFKTSGQAIIGAGTTVAGLLAVIPKIHHAFKQNKSVSEDCKKVLNNLKTKIDSRKYINNPVNESASSGLTPETASLIVTEYSKAVSEITKEFNQVVASQNNASDVLKSFINEHQ